MKGSEPFVPGHIVCSVVAIKEPVMQLMEKVSQLDNSLASQEKRLIATVCDDRSQHRELKMIDHMQGAGGNDDMDQRRSHIKQMLQRVHRRPGPGARINVSMVHRVDGLVERLPML